jgi:hypothetical protein
MDEADRVKVAAMIVERAATEHEIIHPSAIRDSMTVAAPVASITPMEPKAVPDTQRAPHPAESHPSGTVVDRAAPIETEGDIVEPRNELRTTPIVGSWAGTVKIVGWTGRTCGVVLRVGSAAPGEVAGVLSTLQDGRPYMEVPVEFVEVLDGEFVLKWKPPLRCTRAGGCNECVLTGVYVAPLDERNVAVVATTRYNSRFKGTLRRQ